jgi:hypothetical protein
VYRKKAKPVSKALLCNNDYALRVVVQRALVHAAWVNVGGTYEIVVTVGPFEAKTSRPAPLDAHGQVDFGCDEIVLPVFALPALPSMVPDVCVYLQFGGKRYNRVCFARIRADALLARGAGGGARVARRGRGARRRGRAAAHPGRRRVAGPAGVAAAAARQRPERGAAAPAAAIAPGGAARRAAVGGESGPPLWGASGEAARGAGRRAARRRRRRRRRGLAAGVRRDAGAAQAARR